VTMLDSASMRVELTRLEREGRDLMTLMNRLGVTKELLRQYEAIDTQIIGLRMRLVEHLRKLVK